MLDPNQKNAAYLFTGWVGPHDFRFLLGAPAA